MQRIRKDDLVQVMSGKDKGRTGKVLKVLPKEAKVIIEGVALVKRHQKASPTGAPAGIVEKASKVHMSKVMPIDPKSKKPTRVGFKADGEKKQRTAKSKAVIETAA